MDRNGALKYMRELPGLHKCRRGVMVPSSYCYAGVDCVKIVTWNRDTRDFCNFEDLPDGDWDTCDDHGNPIAAESTQSRPEIMYGIGDQERLDVDIDECIERYLDYDTHLTEGALEVKKYRRVKVHSFFEPHWLLDIVLERLDDRYSDAADEPTKPTPAMIAAAKAFNKAILDEYVPYNCEPTGEVIMVDISEWIAKNCPEWGK